MAAQQPVMVLNDNVMVVNLDDVCVVDRQTHFLDVFTVNLY